MFFLATETAAQRGFSPHGVGADPASPAPHRGCWSREHLGVWWGKPERKGQVSGLLGQRRGAPLRRQTRAHGRQPGHQGREPLGVPDASLCTDSHSHKQGTSQEASLGPAGVKNSSRAQRRAAATSPRSPTGCPDKRTGPEGHAEPPLREGEARARARARRPPSVRTQSVFACPSLPTSVHHGRGF